VQAAARAAWRDQHTLATIWLGRSLQVEEVSGTYEAVMGGRVMLCEIISQVVDAATPMYNELTLVVTNTNPIKTHVYGLGAPPLDRFVDDARGAGIVSLNRRGFTIELTTCMAPS
jgi:hypothetical protein